MKHEKNFFDHRGETRKGKRAARSHSLSRKKKAVKQNCTRKKTDSARGFSQKGEKKFQGDELIKGRF